MCLFDEHSKGDWLRCPVDGNEIFVDFINLEEKAGLHFDEGTQWGIQILLVGYVIRVRSFEERASAKKVQSKMRAVVKACRVLEAILDFSRPGKPSNDYDDLDYRAWFRLLRGESRLATLRDEQERFQMSGGQVSDYLIAIRTQAEKVLAEKGSPGNRKNYALRDFLSGLYNIYRSVGGEGRGCHRVKEGKYRGPFLVFAKELLDCTEYRFEKSQLYDYIKEINPA